MATAIETDQTQNLTPSPTRPDGSSWPFALLVGDDTIYADSRTELVGKLIPGYSDYATGDEGDALAFLARVDMAAGIAAEAQATVLASMTESDEFAPERESEAVLTALLSPRGTGLVTGEEFDSRWDHPVPLVLLSTDYIPVTSHPRIEGNVQYIDPTNETTLLASLEQFGFVQLFVNADI